MNEWIVVFIIPFHSHYTLPPPKKNNKDIKALVAQKHITSFSQGISTLSSFEQYFRPAAKKKTWRRWETKRKKVFFRKNLWWTGVGGSSQPQTPNVKMGGRLMNFLLQWNLLIASNEYWSTSTANLRLLHWK